MIYALGLSGKIVNIIVISDQSTLSNYSSYDFVVRIDGMTPQPGIGWTTSDHTTFTAPPYVAPIIKQKSSENAELL